MSISKIAECIMVDTLGLRIPDVDVSLLPKKYKQVGGGEETKWSTGSLETEEGKISLHVRGVKTTRECWATGSVAMHYQGHNIVSTNNVPMLAHYAARDLNRKFKLGLDHARAEVFAQGMGMQVSRLDTPIMAKIPEGFDMRAVINGIALAGLLAGYDTSLYSGKTVYFDQHSQLSSLKGYDKAAQLRGLRNFKIPESDATGDLTALTKLLRLEPVYRQKFLQRRFPNAGQLTPALFTPELMAELFVEMLGRYDLSRDLRRPLNQEQLLGIPREYRAAVMAWQYGHDPRKVCEFSETHYSRCKAALWNIYKINLGGPPPTEIEGRIELGDILSPENFVPVPESVRNDSNLFFDPDKDWTLNRVRELKC